MTIWVPGSHRQEWALVTDRGPARSKVDREVDGGTRLLVQMPSGAHRLELQDGRGRAEWALRIADGTVRRDVDQLVALGRSGKYADALARLEELRKETSEEACGPIDAGIARMALALGRVDRAEPAFRASIAAGKAEGRLHDVVKDGAGLLWALVHLQQRYSDARQLLEEMTPFGRSYPEGQVWLDYHAGLLASDTADVRTALDRYRRAARGATRLGLTSMADSAADEIARVLTRIGSVDEAVSIARQIPMPAEPCAQSTRALNLSEALMEQATHRQSHERNAEVTAALVATRSTTESCPDPHRRLLALVYSAEYALEIGDDAEAERWVQALKASPPDRDVLRASRRSDLIGQWLLHRRQYQAALAAFEESIPAARAAGLLEETFRGEVGSGRSLLALGHRRGAVAHLKRAQEAMEAMLRGIPLAEGRGSFLSGHDSGIRYLIDALVRGGAIGEAERTARRARSIELVHAARLDRLARLPAEARRRWDEALGKYQRIRAEVEREAENDWTVPRTVLATLRTARQERTEQARAALDDAYRLLSEQGAKGPDFSPPGPGECHVVFFPGVDGWFALAATAGHVVARQVEPSVFASPQAAARVLDLLSSELDSAHRVRLFPYGASNNIDWQAVNWHGRPLLAAMQVEYALDVGARTMSGGEHDSVHDELNALVVSNPTGDLPGASQEATTVATLLADWQVMRLEGHAATRAATLATLSNARLLHYAGHAEVSGSQGLSSALLLRGGARIELGDLLAAVRVPAVVVLSACDAAGTVERMPSMMGLAQAFIAAGSRVAIAPTHPVADEAARSMVSKLYPLIASSVAQEVRRNGHLTDGKLVDLVRAAFREAMLTSGPRRSSANNVISERRTADDVRESFRLLVP